MMQDDERALAGRLVRFAEAPTTGHGVSEEALDDLESQLRTILPCELDALTLPLDYRALMGRMDGMSRFSRRPARGEGDQDEDEWVDLEIYPIERVTVANVGWQAGRSFPGLLIFGGTGNGDGYAYDPRFRPMPVVFCNHDSGEVGRYCGADLLQFLQHLTSASCAQDADGGASYRQAVQECGQGLAGEVRPLPAVCLAGAAATGPSSPDGATRDTGERPPPLSRPVDGTRAVVDPADGHGAWMLGPFDPRGTPAAGTPADPPPGRGLRFPGTPLGMLFLRPWAGRGPWERHTEARGHVAIPEGSEVQLRVYPAAGPLGPLAALAPGDIQALSLAHTLYDDRDLGHFPFLDGLHTLDLRFMARYTAWLLTLPPLPRLQHLALAGSGQFDRWRDTGEQLRAALAPRAGLRTLDLSYGAEIDGEVLAGLAALPRLEALDLSGSYAAVGLHLDRVAALPALRALRLAYASLGPRALANLGLLTNLRALDLSGRYASAGLDDGALARLAALTGLVSLRLDWQPISDRGLERLGVLRGLRYLSLRGTDVSRGGIAALAAALPACTIVPPRGG